MLGPNRSILYRAKRLRFIVGAITLPLVVAGLIALMWFGAIERDFFSLLIWCLLVSLYGWLIYIAMSKLMWPPEVEISPAGFRYVNRALRVSGTYRWDELDGPSKSWANHGMPLMQMVVKRSGKKLLVPPTHFGATYDEMADIVRQARSGRVVEPNNWRASHPVNRGREWMLDWGAPLLAGSAVAVGLILLGL